MFFSVNNNFINTIGKTIIGLEEKCLVYEKKKITLGVKKRIDKEKQLYLGK